MGNEWTRKKVIELQEAGILLVQDGNHGNDRPRTEEFTQTGVAFIRAADMDGGRVLFESAECINEAGRHRVRKGIGAGGDVLLSHKGTVGKVALAPIDAPPFVCSPQTTFWRTLDNQKLDRRFLFQYLKSKLFQDQLASRAGETDMAGYVSLTNQRLLEVTIPSPAEQKAIAHILGTLDDKIELNRRMNGTLEAMARALFQSWFVDFDPVRAKQQGRPPAGMDAVTAALFPAEFEETSFGLIPRGWKPARLKELTSKIGSGATPRGGSSVYVDDGVALIRSQNVHDYEFRWDGLARLSDKSATELKGVEVKPKDVLLNITGDSILRTCVVDPSALPARVNQHVAIIRAADAIPARYLHLQLVREQMKSFLLGLSAGATRQAVTKGHLEEIEILKPTSEVLAAFDEVTDPLYRLVENNRRHSRTLAALRDALLPKLLSGELSVSGKVEAAAFTGA